MQVSLIYSTLLPAALFLLSSTYLTALYLAAQRREKREARERTERMEEPESFDSVVESELGPGSQTSTLTLSDNNNR